MSRASEMDCHASNIAVRPEADDPEVHASSSLDPKGVDALGDHHGREQRVGWIVEHREVPVSRLLDGRVPPREDTCC